MTVRFRPPEPPRQPRLEHVRAYAVAPSAQAQHVLTAAIYRTDTGRELRVGFSLDNLIHSECRE